MMHLNRSTSWRLSHPLNLSLVPETSATAPTLTVCVLGTFHLAINDIPTNHTIVSKSRTVFEYLLIHHDQPVARDVLMDVFWPQRRT